jgi:phage protein D/phage baseplate assembly protein gpV
MPGPSQVLVPLYRIIVNGQGLDPVEADAVHQIKITDFLRLPDICTLQVGYPADDGPDPFKNLDDSKFQVGAALEVKLGGTDDRVTKPLFKGEIVTVEPDFEAGGASMVVRAYDWSHRLMRSRKQRTFLNAKVSDIVRRVLQENGLRAAVEEERGDPLESVVQNSESDWDFIWRLARRIGFELTVNDRVAEFKPPEQSTPLELAYPEHLHAFRPRITAVQQVQTVNVRGFDSKTKQVAMGSASTPRQVTQAGITRQQVRDTFPGAVIEIGGQAFKTQSEASTIAQATLDQLANAYLTAEGECDGNPLIKAGARIRISGVGRKYSGVYRVAKAVHMLTAGGYVTQFSNSAGEHTLLGQSGGANGGPRRVDSIVVGIVTNNRDPDGLGRVKVTLPSVSEVETAWAPLLVPSAGNQRGMMMMPQPNDQVIIAFENGDPSYPVVLGSMFNGRDKPGAELLAADKNNDGSFAVRSDHAALIHANEDITLHSDKGKWVVKLDGGEIQETVKQGAGGSGGYTGDFGGSWNLKATGGVTVESSQSVTVKAPSITVDASASLTLKGAAVDIKGSGVVNISGAMINIG